MPANKLKSKPAIFQFFYRVPSFVSLFFHFSSSFTQLKNKTYSSRGPVVVTSLDQAVDNL